MSHFEGANAVAFVTGANRPQGIGRAIVDSLLAAGAKKVYATARVKDQLRDLVAAHPDRVVAIELDVTDEAAIRAAAVAAPDVNLLVNSSGVFAGSCFPTRHQKVSTTSSGRTPRRSNARWRRRPSSPAAGVVARRTHLDEVPGAS